MVVWRKIRASPRDHDLAQGASYGVVICFGETAQGGESFVVEAIDGFGIGESLDRLGEGAGFIKVEQADFAKAVPERVAQDEDSVAF